VRASCELDWTERFAAPITGTIGRLPDGIHDDEIVALDTEGKPSFPALQGALTAQDGSKLVYFVFDLLHDGKVDWRKRPLAERKARLRIPLESTGNPSRLRYVEHFETSGDTVLRSACRLDLEGAVSKRLDAPCLSGSNDHWRKSKCRGGQEVVIGGWTTTDERFRSLLAGIYRNGRLYHVGQRKKGSHRSAIPSIAANRGRYSSILRVTGLT
jgi:bifunctional non-homologous end joining protein LigD